MSSTPEHSTLGNEPTADRSGTNTGYVLLHVRQSFTSHIAGPNTHDLHLGRQPDHWSDEPSCFECSSVLLYCVLLLSDRHR